MIAAKDNLLCSYEALDRAEAAFWRSAVMPAEAARAVDRPAGIGPKDAPLPIGMATAYRWHGWEQR